MIVKGEIFIARTGENIFKRKDGRWEARYILYRDHNNKAKYKYLYAPTYSQVKAKLISAQNEPYNFRKNERTFGFLMAEWLNFKKTYIKNSTYVRYKNAVNGHLIPIFGEQKLSKITTAQVQDFIRQKLENGRLDGRGAMSPKSVGDVILVFKEAIKYAKNNGEECIINFERISVKKTPKEMRVLSQSEEKRLCEVLLKNTDRLKAGVLLCLYTGIRIGELCALKTSSISLSEKTIKVSSTLQRLQTDGEKRTEIILTDPKTHNGHRIIPLADFLIEVIAPFVGIDEIFFLSGYNRPIEPRTMQNRFKSYLKLGEIEDANFHSLRHTFATRGVEAGFDLKTLSEILGHSSVKITLDKYVHSSLVQKRANIEKLKLAQ